MQGVCVFRSFEKKKKKIYFGPSVVHRLSLMSGLSAVGSAAFWAGAVAGASAALAAVALWLWHARRDDARLRLMSEQVAALLAAAHRQEAAAKQTLPAVALPIAPQRPANAMGAWPDARGEAETAAEHSLVQPTRHLYSPLQSPQGSLEASPPGTPLLLPRIQQRPLMDHTDDCGAGEQVRRSRPRRLCLCVWRKP